MRHGGRDLPPVRRIRGMRWAGALAMGMGGCWKGISNDSRGGKKILDALAKTAEALARGGEVPARRKRFSQSH